MILKGSRLICPFSTVHTEREPLKGCEQVSGKKSQHKGRAGELGLPGIHIECKRAEQLRPYSWLEQAERDAVRFGDGLPAVFFRRSRSPWLVVMKLEDWLKIYRTQSEPRKTAPSE